MDDQLKFYSKGEEIANAVTHGIGTLLSIAALVLLIVFSVEKGDKWYVISYTIYGISMFILYLGSTLYHSITNVRAKRVLRIFDHASIYLLIAGTYTPFTLTILRSSVGWVIFGIIWALAILGIIMKIFWVGKYEIASTLLYIFMGWIIIFAMKKLLILLSPMGIALLVAGGIIYTAGAFLYMMNKVPYNHAIWHIFVIGGSACHFFCILLYLFPNS
ncbi:hemolysin III family protein [Clostridium sp. MT-14]|uniref:PAQR family membrane homeostasis protein TrhA n=1 Tax=unclassified Clostridium TaxID=2614128 RepID=UPI001238777C|nr:hemolysin III family protein [Clostridium sp. HV4-5-A1G]KAA8669104.1 hemolysin III family protein [Clostridium sp. HV4-5-A1G]CAB1251390.1 putative membrane hydrolase [Clostridiaceae bacterium BL-3]